MITTLTEKQIKSVMADMKRYRQDPIGFQCNVLDVNPDHVWPKMEEVALSVRDNKKTAVKAGHSVSKTFEAGRLALWFLLAFGPRSTVITTAPTNTQVEQLLWREIRDAYNNAKVPLGGRLSTKKLDIDDKWFALGFATKPDTATQEASKFAGFHNQHIFIVFDEASGVLPPIWKATEGLLSSGGMVRFLAIGNPLSAYGNFADCFEPDSGYNQITISVKDTPNFKAGKELIPGLAGVEYYDDMVKKYGEKSNEVKKRCLGELPTYTEGTFYGPAMAKVKFENRIGYLRHKEGVLVHTFWDIGDVHTAIWFAQFIKDRVHLVDFYYDNNAVGLPEYAKVIKSKPYNYGGHYGPPDLWESNAKSFQTGKATKDVAAELGIHFKRVGKHSFNDRIEVTRLVLNDCWFSLLNCRDGLDALSNYRKKKNENKSTEKRTVYHDLPVKDWTCHPADAFGYMCMHYKYGVTDGKRLGSTWPTRNEFIPDVEDYDPLGDYR